MKKFMLTVGLMLCIAFPVEAADGVINVQSFFNAKETAKRYVKIVKDKDMTVFDRINHTKNAKKVGVQLRYTELIIFGNPNVGSTLMKCQQRVALDLPQKVLIWEDEQGLVWITYNDPEYLVQRHTIDGCKEVIAKVKSVLAGIAKAAASD